MRGLIGASLLAAVVALAGCADVQLLGAAAAEKRRVMNDLQARATMAAVCDMSLGSYLRELNAVERRYAGLICGDDEAIREAIMMEPLPMMLKAREL